MNIKYLKQLLQFACICIVSIPMLSWGQIKFNKFYTLEEYNQTYNSYSHSGTINDFVIDPSTQETYIVGSSENDVVVSGYASHFGYLGKLDLNGNPLWLKLNKKIGIESTGENNYKKVIITSDNHILALTGTFNKSGRGSGRNFIGGQMMLHKMDKNGNLLPAMQRNYGFIFNNGVASTKFTDGRSLIEATDNSNIKSYAAAGQSIESYNAFEGYILKTKIIAFKTQTNLTPIWKKKYSLIPANQDGEEYANCIYQTSDKNFVMTGYSDGKVFVMKVAENTGLVIWARRYSLNAAISIGESIIEDANGNILVTGSMDGKAMLLSLTSNGILNWCDLVAHNYGDAIGKTLMKGANTNEIYIGGTLPGYQSMFIFNIKADIKLCNGVPCNTYSNFKQYLTYFDFNTPIYNKMVRENSGGFKFMCQFPLNFGQFSQNYKFNFVSTDDQFISTKGIKDMSEYCIPTETTPIVSSFPLTYTDYNDSISDLTYENVTYDFDPARVTSYVYCENCPDVITNFINLEYCTIDGNNGVWYQPYNSLPSGDKYILKGVGNNYYYNSEAGYYNIGTHITGAIAHHLVAGNYKIEYYSSNGCLLNITNITVSPKNPDIIPTVMIPITYCKLPGKTGVWVNPCDYFGALPNNFRFTSKDLNIPPRGPMYNSEDWVAQHGGNGCIAMFMEDGSYEVELFDKTNCKISKFIFNIIPNQPSQSGSFLAQQNFCMTPGVTGMMVNPCDIYNTLYGQIPSSFVYTIKDLQSPNGQITFNSDDYAGANGGNGCIPHFMTNGYYEVDFYDKTNCSFKRITISVNGYSPILSDTRSVTKFFCSLTSNGRWINPCTIYEDIYGPNSLPVNFMYTSSDNQTPPRSAEFNSDDWVNAGNGSPCIAHFMENGSYTINVYDKNNCTYKSITVNIVDNLNTIVHPNPFTLKICLPLAQVKVNLCNLFKNYYAIPQFTLPADFSYTLTDISLNPTMPPFNSDQLPIGNKCPDIFLNEGTYSFEFFDKTNCTKHKITINVIKGICDESPEINGEDQSMPTNENQISPEGTLKSNGNSIGLNQTNGLLNDVKLYPNPGTGVFKIQFGTSVNINETYTAVITDINGKLIATHSNVSTNSENSFDVSEYANGVYIVKIIQGDNIKYFKYIKN